MDDVTPADMQAVARKHFTDDGLLVTTLPKDALPPGIGQAPARAAVGRAAAWRAAAPAATPAPARPAAGGDASGPVIVQKSVLPQLEVKRVFDVGSPHDPTAKEGVAALTAAMIQRAGSKAMTVDQIGAAL